MQISSLRGWRGAVFRRPRGERVAMVELLLCLQAGQTGDTVLVDWFAAAAEGKAEFFGRHCWVGSLERTATWCPGGQIWRWAFTARYSCRSGGSCACVAFDGVRSRLPMRGQGVWWYWALTQCSRWWRLYTAELAVRLICAGVPKGVQERFLPDVKSCPIWNSSKWCSTRWCMPIDFPHDSS